MFGSTATVVNETDKDLCSQEASLPPGEIGRKQYTGPRVEKKSGSDEGKEEPGVTGRGLQGKLWDEGQFQTGGQRLSKDMREGGMSGGRACRAEGMASAKALRVVCDWHVQGIARRPVWLRGAWGRAAEGVTW